MLKIKAMLCVFLSLLSSSRSVWVLKGSDIDGTIDNELNGVRVAMDGSGDTIAVGASGASYNFTNQGRVRVYDYNGSTWQQRGQDIYGERYQDMLYHVSLSNDSMVLSVGSIEYDGPYGNLTSVGHVKVFEWNSGTWTQRGAAITGEAFGDNSASDVSLNSAGDIIAIGASFSDENGADSGHVRVFQWDGSNWNQLGQDIPGEALGDRSGISVSLSAVGDVLAVGAHHNNATNYHYSGSSKTGHVRIYDWDSINSLWIQRGVDIDGSDIFNSFGVSVSLSASGNIVAIGAPYHDGSNGTESGEVRVLYWDATDSTWKPRGVSIEGEAEDDESGTSVSLNDAGTILTIGSPQNDYSKGQVRSYLWDGSTWVQFGNDIDGEFTGDQSGYSIDSSASGKSIVIGARLNPGVDPILGHYQGHVRVYEWMIPTASPTASPTLAPTASPTLAPTASPTASPTAAPTLAPTALPTASPTQTIEISENSTTWIWILLATLFGLFITLILCLQFVAFFLSVA